MKLQSVRMKKAFSFALALMLALGVLVVAPAPAKAWPAATALSGAAAPLATSGLYDISGMDPGATISITASGVALTGTHASLSVTLAPSMSMNARRRAHHGPGEFRGGRSQSAGERKHQDRCFQSARHLSGAAECILSGKREDSA